MKRLFFLAPLLLLACASKPGPGNAKDPTLLYFQVDPNSAGQLHGAVKWKEERGARKRISMDAEEDCAKLHKTPVYDDPNSFAFVYIKTGLEGKNFAPSSETVLIDQKGCQFVPRVVGARTGQKISVKNSDPVSHSIHPMPQNSREWNQQQTPGAPNLERRFVRPEVLIPVKCNIHAWMKAYIAVVEHPFFAVVSREKPDFDFSSLPPGKYQIAAWHELHGERTKEVELAPKGKLTLDFDFSAAQ